ncbi:DUF898 family protein [Microvirga thermotolerans]|uniref:DUF898 family protein n=2 Tax=Microvirga thermotolerans TaxID=2651334 RepID=A0A5P9K2Z9_9HYPH|nr:DUF898 family protein [Microvirga thermotolerans]
MSFSGRGREFLRLLVTGSLFQIPTFGFYRFWLITKLRRHLWSNTQVAGEAFEYTGTAKELLIGFLVALAVLTPIYIAYFILGLLLEEKQALAGVPLVIVLYVLAHFGAYRARRYRATRTVFRGLRFWMKGSGWAYAVRAVLWDIATILTLGLAMPWASASLERYRMRHTYFGTIQGDFVGTGWTLFKRAWWGWALMLAILAGGGAFLARVAATDPQRLEGVAGLVVTGMAFLALGFVPAVTAIMVRWQLEGIRFGEVAVSSRLGAGAFYGTYFKLIFSSLGFILAFVLVVALGAAVLSGALKGAFAQVQAGAVSGSTVAIFSMIALGYLLFLLGFGVIQRYFMGRGLWAVTVNSLSVTNLHALDEAVAAGRPAGAMGEGLADALDFNVGL